MKLDCHCKHKHKKSRIRKSAKKVKTKRRLTPYNKFIKAHYKLTAGKTPRQKIKLLGAKWRAMKKKKKSFGVKKKSKK